MLIFEGNTATCSECGREYSITDDILNEGDGCPSDDCPSHDDEEFVFEEVDAGDPFDIEYDH